MHSAKMGCNHKTPLIASTRQVASANQCQHSQPELDYPKNVYKHRTSQIERIIIAMAFALATSLLGPTSIPPQAFASTASISNNPECRDNSSRYSGLVLSSSVSHSSFRIFSHGGICSASEVLGGGNGCCRGDASSIAPRFGISGRPVASWRCQHPRRGATSSGSLRLDSAARRLLVEKKNGIVQRKVTVRIAAEGTDITKVAGTILKLGKDCLDAATKLFPESVPRPLAQAAVGVAATAVLSWFLRSIFSTLTFVLAIGALSLAAFVFLTKTVSESVSDTLDKKDSKEGQGDSDNILDSARKIMDKYK